MMEGSLLDSFLSMLIAMDWGPTPGSSPQLADWDIEVRGGNTLDFPPFEYTPASTKKRT